MTLEEYLKMNKISFKTMACELKVAPTIIWRWVKQKRIPRQNYMQKIFEWTHGAVKPADFYPEYST